MLQVGFGSADITPPVGANIAVAKAGVKLQGGFNRRFDASARRVCQAIEEDEIGEPHLLRILSRDPALIVLKFANGVIGTIDNSRKAVYGYDQQMEVFGSKGSVRTENHYPNQAMVSTAHRIYRDLPLNFFLERYADSFIAENAAFVDAVLHDKPVPVSGEDGRAPVVMALAARRSYEENRPVRLRE